MDIGILRTEIKVGVKKIQYQIMLEKILNIFTSCQSKSTWFDADRSRFKSKSSYVIYMYLKEENTVLGQGKKISEFVFILVAYSTDLTFLQAVSRNPLDLTLIEVDLSQSQVTLLTCT